ncbi:MAG: GPR endopeptidase [Eubacteriales bacterium]
MPKRNSDLIIENFGLSASEPPSEARAETYERMGFLISAAWDGDCRYHTVVTGKLWKAPPDDRHRCVRLCASLLRDYLNDMGIGQDARILFAGIGNPRLASDALGPKTCDRILVTRGDGLLTGLGFPEISAVQPGVPSRTGLDTAEQVSLLAHHMNAHLILTVDSVAARARERLQTVIQITDGGMTPGSALAHTSSAITPDTMHRPVLSIGVPMVIRADLLDESFGEEPMFVTRAETDEIADCYAGILAGAINLALSGNVEISGL